MKRAELEAAVTRLAMRVETLERQRRMDTHVHFWTYEKKVYGEYGGVSWVWTCNDPECPQGSGTSTTDRTHLPDHFPAALR